MSNTSLTSIKPDDISEKYPLNALVPKHQIQADSFLKRYPEYDGRGIIVAIFDTGVDPGSIGLSKTSDGKRKIIDVVDATGSGDVKMGAAIKIPEDRIITGLSGRKLEIPLENQGPKWANPKGEVRLGFKSAYDLFPKDLVNRVSKLHKEKVEEEHANLVADLKQQLLATTDKRMKSDIELRISYLENIMGKYKDVGPILDIVSWHDGNTWRAVIVGGNEEKVNLSTYKPLAAYKLEYEFSTFSQEDLMNYSLNFYDDGEIVSIVTTSGAHGTHVCGIVGAFHETEPELNGVAPGVQFVSVKIGDSRLGSMETGTGLVRGLIAAKEAGCHLVNMSYGEATSMTNIGRFSSLVKKFVNEHGIIFVSSAGNSGPCTTTVGAPAATTPGLISVGAHVTEDMMEAQYSMRETPPQNHFTWSSRGPAADGGLGVNISSPGCSISPVPNYTLSKNQRMNGTSMSSPNACGGISLLLSALKSQKKQWNPAYIQKAIENTAKPLESVSPLAMGYGLLHIEDAYHYIQDFPYDPQMNMWYTVNCLKNMGRGIYLRERHETETEFEDVIDVTPHFQKDTSNVHKINFEKRLRLISNQEWIHVPKFFHLSNGSKTFNVLVDPTKLERGEIHLGEIVAIDADDSSEGPIFRIPVTVMKPHILPENQFTFKKQKISLQPADLHRFLIHVPKGARSATFTIESEDFAPHSKRILVLHALQLLPKKNFQTREIKHFLNIHPFEKKVFTMAVTSEYTMEVVLGQFWSSLGASCVNFTIEFEGVTLPNEITIFDPVSSLPVQAELRNQSVNWKASFNRASWYLRPHENEIVCRKDSRNLLFTKKYIHDMTLKYNLTIGEDGKYLVVAPVLHSTLYESEFESRMIQIFDKNKKLIHTSDYRPTECQLTKGTYLVILHIRHDNIKYLEGMSNFCLIAHKILSTPLTSTLYKGSINNTFTGSKANTVTQSYHPKGSSTVLYIAAPKTSSSKELKSGMWLEGTLQWNSQSLNPVAIKYVIPPEVKEKANSTEEAKEIKKLDTRSPQEQLKDTLIDTRVKFTTTLLKEKESDGENLLNTLLDAFPRDLRVLSLKLNHLFDKKERPSQEIVNLCDTILKCIDTDNLAIFFGTAPKKVDPFDFQHKKELQEKKEKKEFLINCLQKRAIALIELAEEFNKSNESSQENPHDENVRKAVQDLRKWSQPKSGKPLLVEILYAIYQGYYGEALDLMKPLLIEKKNDLGDIEGELKELEDKIYESLGWGVWSEYKKKTKMVDNPPDYPLLA